MDSNGWDASAQAWAESQGEAGDFSRSRVLDPALERLIGPVEGLKVLDVGAGEGRYSRVLVRRGARVTALEPCLSLVAFGAGRGGDWVRGGAEQIPLASDLFDLVVSYLVLIDVPDFRAAISEMARVCKPGGRLAIANMNSFATTLPDPRIEVEGGQLFVVDNYFEEQEQHVAWKGIAISNYHRPFEAYMKALLGTGLVLEAFEEPRAQGAHMAAARYNRVPWHHAMVWRKLDS